MGTCKSCIKYVGENELDFRTITGKEKNGNEEGGPQDDQDNPGWDHLEERKPKTSKTVHFSTEATLADTQGNQNDQQHDNQVTNYIRGTTEIIHGQKTGIDKFKYTSGSSYEGEQNEAGYLHGFGKFTWPDGSEYYGQWHENLMHGFGCITYSDGSYYRGHFVNNSFEGFGVRVWADGQEYQGWWYRNKKHGYGISTDINKQQIYGMWDEFTQVI